MGKALSGYRRKYEIDIDGEKMGLLQASFIKRANRESRKRLGWPLINHGKVTKSLLRRF